MAPRHGSTEALAVGSKRSHRSQSPQAPHGRHQASSPLVMPAAVLMTRDVAAVEATCNHMHDRRMFPATGVTG
jgi:hypothetical protein